ncbi:MAG: DUF4158 domain-containing protein [Pseudonocardiaceae bacterium]
MSDADAAAFGRYDGVPSRAELERFFFLDDADMVLVGQRRGDHNRLGFSLQLVTARYLGRFLPDPLAGVPPEVIDYLAEQLGIDDPSCLKRYSQREPTHREHAGGIARVFELRDFSEVEAELTAWVDARAWTSGDGPKAIFDGAARWLRQEKVLLPGVTTLARLVARVRDGATNRLWGTLYALLTANEAIVLERLLEIADGDRVSVLERLRKGPTSQTGREMVLALERVAKIVDLGVGSTDVSAVPHRKVLDLARYGMTATPTQLSRHPVTRRLATLLSTVVYLQGRAVDDALELLDVLMAAKLIGPVKRAVDKETLRRYPKFSRESSKLAAAVEVLLEATDFGEDITLTEVWESIEVIVSRRELRAAVAAVTDSVPPPDADRDGEFRAGLVDKIATVRGFLPLLCEHIEFGSTQAANPVLTAMKDIGPLIKPVGPPSRKPLSRQAIDPSVVTGSWKRLVFDKPGLPAGAVDRSAYVICVLEQFHHCVKRREIYATNSTRWGDPRAHLLDGKKWAAARAAVLTALRLPEDPTELLARHTDELDARYREVAGRFADNTGVSVDEQAVCMCRPWRRSPTRPAWWICAAG